MDKQNSLGIDIVSLVFFAVVIFGILALFGACTQPELKNVQIPKCEFKKYSISKNITINTDQELYNKNEFRILVLKSLRESGCFEFEELDGKLDSELPKFDLILSHKTSEESELKDINIAKATDTLTLKTEINLQLKNTKMQISQHSNSTMQVVKSQYFGVGENETKKKYFENLLTQNMAFIIGELKK